MKQRTVKSTIEMEGIGLHTGEKMSLVISPAYPDTGICFRRSDIECEYTRVSPYTVTSTQLATTIQCGNNTISTIEHLMAALYGLGIDNAKIDVCGPEVPVFDGSSTAFVNAVYNAGVTEQAKARKFIKFKKRIRLEKDGKWIEVIPSRFFKVTFDIEFENESIGQQKSFINVTPESFTKELASARTFGFRHEVEQLWQMGLAKGGSLDTAVVIDGTDVLNPEGLRYRDEFVRHKMLDLVGDISLLGFPIFGHIRAYKSGHNLNNLFARTLIESANYYDIIELPDTVPVQNHNLELKPQGIS
ncbi:MAG: UDP-3-O-acyl-N-acetylglucosamine deacetylase [Denitrovibrio sp.]|nr:MAG: UDP-3-O-acyl-N-acetylglucosamine deacetylase [Denitrovibrio sp.]